MHRHASTATALIKLRASISLKNAGAVPSKTAVFLFLYPENIQSIILDKNELNETLQVRKIIVEQRNKVLVPARRRVGVDGVEHHDQHYSYFCLRFHLNKPAALVFPKTPETLVPKNQASGNLIASLQMLALETEFVLYFPAVNNNIVSETQLRSLCEAASSHGVGLTSIPWQADLSSLYGGRGGRIVNNNEAAEEKEEEDPPSYDEVGPGPPLPPIEASEGKGERFTGSYTSPGGPNPKG